MIKKQQQQQQQQHGLSIQQLQTRLRKQSIQNNVIFQHSLSDNQKSQRSISQTSQLSICSKYSQSQYQNQQQQWETIRQKIPLKVVNNMKQYPYQSIGWLNIIYQSKIQYATGILISKSIIITTAHSIYQRTPNSNIFQQPKCIIFYFTQKSYFKGSPRSIKSVYIHPKYKTCQLFTTKLYDIALLELSQPISFDQYDSFKFLSLAIMPQPRQSYRNTKVTLFGYPQQLISEIDFKKQLVFIHKSQSQKTKFQTNFCYYNASTENGMNGSPILVQHENHFFVIGIHARDTQAYSQGLLFTQDLIQQLTFNQKQKVLGFQSIFNPKMFKKLPPKLKLQKNIKKRKDQTVQIINQKAIFKNMNDQNIISQLQKIKNIEFTQILIKNDWITPVTNNIQVTKKLSTFKKVQKINLVHCFDISPLISTKIISYFEKNQLKQIILSCHKNNFQQFFIYNLCIRFPNLIRFQYNRRSNTQNFQTIFQDSFFMQFNFKQDTSYLSNQQIIQLSQLKKLQNIDIYEIQDQLAYQILNNMKNLKQLTIGNWYKQQQLLPQFIQSLMKLTNLKTLQFIRTKIEDKQTIEKVMKIISQNKDIDTLVIDQSFKGLKDKHFQIIGQNLKSLKKLLCYYLPNITGKYFQKLNKQLKVLFMIKCQTIQKDKFINAVSKMNKLTHLLLPGNKWVDDQVLQVIGKNCKYIQMLNIQSCPVTGQGLLKLSKLKRLKCLICGYCQKLTGNNLVQLSKSLTGIRKLSITGMISRFKRQHFSAQDLLKIDSNCNPGITHLNISKCDIGVNSLSKMKALKVFKVESKFHFRQQEQEQLQSLMKQKEIFKYIYH